MVPENITYVIRVGNLGLENDLVRLTLTMSPQPLKMLENDVGGLCTRVLFGL